MSGGGGVMQIPYWIWGGLCKFRTDLGGGHMNSARAWPPFSGPPQHFSNEHSLNVATLYETIFWVDIVSVPDYITFTYIYMYKRQIDLWLYL